MRSTWKILVFVFLFAAIASPAHGQNACVAVQGVAQEHLLDFANPDWQGGRPGDPWVGPVQLVLGKDEVLVGKISENDGDPGPAKGTGQGRNGSYYFDFGADGSFVVRYDGAVWPDLPRMAGAAVVGTFKSQGKVDITSGTGRFAKTTGNIMTDGAYVAWSFDPPPPSGRFNNTITGTLCNVAPK